MHASLTSVVAILALASSSALASPHYSHGIRALSHPHHGVELLKARTLGSRGKGGPNRLNRRGSAGEAVLKCTSTKTFQLCDGDRCTDMGSVAAGTMCKDGAITWDTTNEATPEDSQSASSSIAQFVSSKSESASSSASVSAAEASVRVKQNAVQTSSSSSFTTPGPSATKAASSPAPSSASPSSSSSANDGDGEDWECEADGADATDSSSSSSDSAPSSTSAASQTSVAPQLVAQANPTTTTQAPSSTSAAPIVSASVSVGTGGGSDWITGGYATYFYQGGGYGACGKIHQDDQFGVALQIDRYGTSSNSNPDCGKTVIIKNNANGKTVEAQVWDACPGCKNYNSLDLSVAAFDAIGDQSTGVLDISWKWA